MEQFVNESAEALEVAPEQSPAVTELSLSELAYVGGGDAVLCFG